jgi:hypothetical protein
MVQQLSQAHHARFTGLDFTPNIGISGLVGGIMIFVNRRMVVELTTRIKPLARRTLPRAEAGSSGTADVMWVIGKQAVEVLPCGMVRETAPCFHRFPRVSAWHGRTSEYFGGSSVKSSASPMGQEENLNRRY